MSDAAIFFSHEQALRCQAARSRDLAASASDAAGRRDHLADVARHLAALPGSLNERMLIERQPE